MFNSVFMVQHVVVWTFANLPTSYKCYIQQLFVSILATMKNGIPMITNRTCPYFNGISHKIKLKRYLLFGVNVDNLADVKQVAIEGWQSLARLDVEALQLRFRLVNRRMKQFPLCLLMFRKQK